MWQAAADTSEMHHPTPRDPNADLVVAETTEPQAAAPTSDASEAAPFCDVPAEAGPSSVPCEEAAPELALAAPLESEPKNEDAPAASSTDQHRAPAARVYTSPADILDKLAPPGFSIRLSFNDHRFKVEGNSEMQTLGKSLERPYNQKSYSKSFTGATTWKEALKDVHRHGWRKHSLLQKEGYVPASSRPQTGGVIDDCIFAQLEPEVKKMPPPKKYN